MSARSKNRARRLPKSIFITGFLCAFIFSIRAAEIPGGPPEAAAIVRAIEKEYAFCVERDEKGDVVGLTLTREYHSDASFKAIATIPTLRRIGFSHINDIGPSLNGILELKKAPKLSELTFRCNQSADFMLPAISQLQQIETLQLVAAEPTNVASYLLLTNMTSLSKLVISSPRHFGPVESEVIAKLASISSVRDVHIRYIPSVQQDVVWPLVSSKAIENLEIKSSRFNLVRTR